eukprot:1151105-Pelagomonas_calceolata.AAC.8
MDHFTILLLAKSLNCGHAIMQPKPFTVAFCMGTCCYRVAWWKLPSIPLQASSSLPWPCKLLLVIYISSSSSSSSSSKKQN